MAQYDSQFARYDPQEIEARWQDFWEQRGEFQADVDPSRPKFYMLEMLPYPSGTLHMGHMRNYTIGDAVARYQRMRGFNVLHPMGWDAFGLPAENAAIKNGIHPREWTRANIAEFKGVCRRFGFSYDWRREIATCDPEYYRWNQWFFLRMLERGLAYRRKSRVNWCPKCATVLANEQVVDGCCWRHEETPVEAREIEQWFLKITAYAEALLDGLDKLAEGWPERVLLMQRNWIGKSQGARVRFAIMDGVGEDGQAAVEIFTTRIDTIYGATAVILSPGHPLLPALFDGSSVREAATADWERLRRQSMRGEDLEAAEKVGFFTGRYAVNPFSGEKVPIWVANFVLAGYGAGAVMSVPAHDQRDFEFARKYGLQLRVVIQPEAGEPLAGETLEAAQTEHGRLVNSAEYSGLASAEAIAKMIADARARGFGEARTTYRLRDWGISRQRYWGTPIPVLYCDKCGMVPVPDDQLPVVLPANVQLTGEGQSPLANVPEFVNAACPRCGGAARRETDTMDTFMDSSWYFYRYTDPHNTHLPFDPAVVKYWLPVDQYVGGITHAILHLLYTRFFCKVMKDLALVDHDEPIQRLFTQGMVQKGGVAMSKSKGNVVGALEMAEKYGADTGRLYTLFAAPPEKDLEWSEQAIEGASRFLHRVYRLVDQYKRWRKRSLEEVLKTAIKTSNYACKFTSLVGNPKKLKVTEIGLERDIDVHILRIYPGGDPKHPSKCRIRISPEIGADPSLNAFQPAVIGWSPDWNMFVGFDATRLLRNTTEAINLRFDISQLNSCQADGLSVSLEDHLYGVFIGIRPDMLMEYITHFQTFHQRRYVPASTGMSGPSALEEKRLVAQKYQTLDRVTHEFEGRWHFNSAIAVIMALVNKLNEQPQLGEGITPNVLKETLEAITLMLAPMTPHLSAELWRMLGHMGDVGRQPWPAVRKDLIRADEYELIIQVNGKLRGKLILSVGDQLSLEDEARALKLAAPHVAPFLIGKEVVRTVVVPGKLVNIVVQ